MDYTIALIHIIGIDIRSIPILIFDHDIAISIGDQLKRPAAYGLKFGFPFFDHGWKFTKIIGSCDNMIGEYRR